MHKHLHIICLNIPYPVNYGGVFDLYYKLPALQQKGIKIHLHCFKYGREEQPELDKFCESVHYYSRKSAFIALSSKCPYIVGSRKNETLFTRLLSDNYPILMEGVHCTYLLNDPRFKNRNCFVRLHNVEFVYYRRLFELSASIFKQIYFKWESKQLQKYEKMIASEATFLPVTRRDGNIYNDLGCTNWSFLPLFLPPWKVSSTEGHGNFCLYHGDLTVAENEKAAIWLIEEVFDALEIPFVIAGKSPSAKLTTLIHKRNNTCLVANPSETEMQDLISKSHINVIPSYNATGIKLKLVNALFNGRHCVVNEATVAGSDLDAACVIATDANSFTTAIETLYAKPFQAEQTVLRHKLLDELFDNEQNAARLVEIIWPT